MAGKKGCGGKKGRSGRRPLVVEIELKKLREQAILGAYKIVNDKLSGIVDKQTVSLAGSLAIHDLSNSVKAPASITDARSITINALDLPALNSALDKLSKLADITPYKHSKTAINPRGINTNKADQNIDRAVLSNEASTALGSVLDNIHNPQNSKDNETLLHSDTIDITQAMIREDDI